MSVLPSRPLATKRSGLCQTVASSSLASDSSKGQTSEPSLTRRNSFTGGMSTREYVSTMNSRSGEYSIECVPSPAVNFTRPVPSKLMRQ